MRNLNKILLMSIMCVACLLLFSSDAFAAGNFMSETASKITTTFKKTKGIILIIGGFGIVGVTFFAIFGKMKWPWLAGLLTGLAVLAATGALIHYATAGGHALTEGGGGSDNIFDFFSGRARDFAIGLQNIAFCLGGFGIVMFTFLAICGKINFKHLGYIFISLFLLSGTGLFISYWTRGHADGLGQLKGFASPKSFTANSAGDTFNSSLGR